MRCKFDNGSFLLQNPTLTMDTLLALKGRDVSSYGIFFSDSDIEFLQAVAEGQTIAELAQEYGVPTTDLRRRKSWLMKRFSHIVGRCQYPVGAYNRPLGAPIEILRLPPEVEFEFLSSRNPQYQIMEVKDLYAQLLTQEILQECYLTVAGSVCKKLNARLRRDELKLPPLAEDSPDDPIYTFFGQDTDFLTDRQKFFLLNVRWGNVTRRAAAQNRDIPPTRVTYEIKDAIRMLKNTF